MGEAANVVPEESGEEVGGEKEVEVGGEKEVLGRRPLTARVSLARAEEAAVEEVPDDGGWWGNVNLSILLSYSTVRQLVTDRPCSDVEMRIPTKPLETKYADRLQNVILQAIGNSTRCTERRRTRTSPLLQYKLVPYPCLAANTLRLWFDARWPGPWPRLFRLAGA